MMIFALIPKIVLTSPNIGYFLSAETLEVTWFATKLKISFISNRTVRMNFARSRGISTTVCNHLAPDDEARIADFLLHSAIFLIKRCSSFLSFFINGFFLIKTILAGFFLPLIYGIDVPFLRITPSRNYPKGNIQVWFSS